MKSFSFIGAAGASTCSFLLLCTIALYRKNKHLHEQVLRLELEGGKDDQNREENSSSNRSKGGADGDKNGTDEKVNSTSSAGNNTRQKKGDATSVKETSYTVSNSSSSMATTMKIKSIHNDNSDGADDRRSKYFALEEIGTITSPYPQRAGTPRQGLLAPHSRSILTLHPSIPKEALDDLEQYSHVWIIFQFHLNPFGKSKDNANGKKGNNSDGSNYRSNYVFKSSKVKPPRAKGKKVGVLATRSPHRPNNIGLSLALIESIEQIETTTSKKRKTNIVKLLGLDLVDGTPVYDIKPYIPSDCVVNISSPSWVSNTDDTLTSVTWTEEAKDFVYEEQQSGSLLPIYPPIVSGQNSVKIKYHQENQKDIVVDAISEIIAQDPRAQYDGRQQSGSFEITFCTLRVCFVVKKQNESSVNNINNDHRYCAVVDKVFRDPGDITARVGTYQHSLALRRVNEAKKTRKN